MSAFDNRMLYFVINDTWSSSGTSKSFLTMLVAGKPFQLKVIGFMLSPAVFFSVTLVSRANFLAQPSSEVE